MRRPGTQMARAAAIARGRTGRLARGHAAGDVRQGTGDPSGDVRQGTGDPSGDVRQGTDDSSGDVCQGTGYPTRRAWVRCPRDQDLEEPSRPPLLVRKRRFSGLRAGCGCPSEGGGGRVGLARNGMIIRWTHDIVGWQRSRGLGAARPRAAEAAMDSISLEGAQVRRSPTT